MESCTYTHKYLLESKIQIRIVSTPKNCLYIEKWDSISLKPVHTYQVEVPSPALECAKRQGYSTTVSL